MKIMIVQTTEEPRKRAWRERNPEKHAVTSNHARTHRRTNRDFICVDGEGMERWCNKCECGQYAPIAETDLAACECGHGKYRHEHVYVLLGCGEHEPLEDINGIHWEAAFDYLYRCFQENPDAVFAGFFLAYDFTQIFKTFPVSKAAKLLTKKGQEQRRRKQRSRVNTMHEHVIGELNGEAVKWEVNFHAGRQLMIRPMDCECPEDFHLLGDQCTWGDNPPAFMRINDTGSFFQTSLLNVINPANWLDPVVSQDEYDDLVKGKERRSHAILDDEMRRYNALENVVLARVLERYRDGLTVAGITLGKDQWYGPGQAAGQWLKKIGDQISRETIEKVTHPDILRAATATYYGGWFEIMAHGHVSGITWEYDINSAYPHVISKLPCLIHGHWQPGTTARETFPRMPKNAEFRIVHATVTGSSPFIGTMPYRDHDNSICRPYTVHGWYWQDELEAAIRAGLIDTVEIGPCIECDFGSSVNLPMQYSYFTYVRECDCPPPCADVTELYRQRKSVDKKSSAGKALKLVLNSLYGKFAQSVGNPPYYNPIYASRITAGCRTMILDAIATHPGKASAVVMIATDGVYFTSQHPSLNLGENLGDWEESQHSNLTLFKPGVYWDDDARTAIQEGKSPKFKARGVSAKYFAAAISGLDRRFSAWNGQYPANAEAWPEASFKITFSMVSAKQALNNHKWDHAGKVSVATVKHSSNPWRKRAEPWDSTDQTLSQGYYDGQLYRSMPRTLKYITTHPYRTEVSGTWQIENGEWEETGITPDGEVTDHIARALGMWER
jgi:hypothetical protein